MSVSWPHVVAVWRRNWTLYGRTWKYTIFPNFFEPVFYLTKTPSEMTKDDVEELKKAGLSEAAVLNLVLVAGYFAFVNRLADGLGINLEDYWEH